MAYISFVPLKGVDNWLFMASRASNKEALIVENDTLSLYRQQFLSLARSHKESIINPKKWGFLKQN